MENQIKCGLFPYTYSAPPPAKHLSVGGLTNGLLAGHFVDITQAQAYQKALLKHLCRYRAGYTKGGGNFLNTAVQSNGNRACCGKYCNIISKETSQKLAQSAWASLVEILGLLSDGYFYHHSIPGEKVPLLGAKGEVLDSLGGLSINDDWLGNVPCTRFVTLWFCC